MEKEEKAKHQIVETYAGDMAQAIKEGGGGMIKKIIHGEEEHEMEKKQLSPESEKNRAFMFTSLLLLFFALITLSFFFFRENISTVSIERQLTPVIFTDKSVFFEVKGFDKDEIAQTILSEVYSTTVKDGGVEGIYLTFDKKVIGLRQFISLLKSSFTSGDNNDFVNDNFLLGVVNNKTNDFFMLLKVRTLADVFDSLRVWEHKMFLDLHGFFGVDISPETKYLLTANFEDGIIENKNARILYNKEGKIVMMYVFADDTSVIIANSENVVHEIMFRLASSQIKK